MKLRKEAEHRTRWLTQQEAKNLIAELPSHLADMAIFTLATGLRQSNVRNLKWENIDLEKNMRGCMQMKRKVRKQLPFRSTQML